MKESLLNYLIQEKILHFWLELASQWMLLQTYHHHEKALNLYLQARDIFNSIGQDQYVNELNNIIEGLEDKESLTN